MAGEEWPDFEVPAEALLPDAERTPPVSTTTPPVAAADTPPPAPAASPAVGATGTTEPPPARTSEPVETVPKYRLDEEIEARNAATREARELRAEIARLQALPPAAAQPPAATPPPVPGATLTPEQIAANDAVRLRLLEVFPDLKALKDVVALAARRGDIEGSLEAQQRYQQAEVKFYDRHANTQLGNLHKMAAEFTGKTVADLPEMTKETLSSRFAAWVAADPGRTARYENLDTDLVGEFWPIFRAAMFDPVRRAESAAAVTSATNRAPLPVGGSQPAPLAGAPPKPAASEDEDAVHSRAWQQVQAASQG